MFSPIHYEEAVVRLTHARVNKQGSLNFSLFPLVALPVEVVQGNMSRGLQNFLDVGVDAFKRGHVHTQFGNINCRHIASSFFVFLVANGNGIISTNAEYSGFHPGV